MSISHTKKEKQLVVSYDYNANAWRSRNVTGVARATSNCHMCVSFDDRSFNDIVCTLSQMFYLAKNKIWIPTYQLKKGDLLLAKDNKTVSVTRVKFIQKSLPVISIEVADTHTFCVGNYNIVTHNMFVPEAAMNTIPLFSAAGIGVSVGLLSNPITATIVGGVIACGVIGYIVKSWGRNRTLYYELNYDTDKIDIYFNDKKQEESNKPEADGQKEKKDNEKNDAQAPGKPTEKDGFIPKKNWDGKKVKHRRGFGWPDKKGNVWILSGPNGHGCPHWDVQLPNGDYLNIVPGGRIRGQK